MLVSPAEPKPFWLLGKVSVRTEEYGADFLMVTKSFGLVGVQRKTIEDLLASLNNSERFAKEMAQMRQLGLGVLLLEGVPQWTNQGRLISRAEFTRAQMYGLLWSVQSLGYWVLSTTSVTESIELLSLFPQWLEKTKHQSLLTRGKSGVKGVWGSADNRDWGIWLLQGFAGIGYETAAAIYDHFGKVPLQWEVTTQDLQTVKGVGKGRAEALWRSLNPSTPPSGFPSSRPSTPPRTRTSSAPKGNASPFRSGQYIDVDQI